MPRCTRKGCGREYDSAANTADDCTYHSGAPVFHEGLKSWSCCADVSKPVLEFDEFMKIPGCTKGTHTDDAPQLEAPKSTSGVNLKVIENPLGNTSESRASNGPMPIAAVAMAPAPPAPVIEEEDDPSIPVKAGTTCQRKGCGVAFQSDEVNRVGDGPGTLCTYHPAPPIFREGSKGYLCCKRRVLEFDEFLKIQGCKTGRHLFAPKVTDVPQAEESVDCRIDHYQTSSEVHVSVFAKKVDQERSTIKFDETQVHFDLNLPGSKRFQRSVDLFGPIDPTASSYKYFGTKVEAILKKKDTRSWTLLEKTTRDLGNINLTFGVGGRTGTVGAKTPVVDGSNKAT